MKKLLRLKISFLLWFLSWLFLSAKPVSGQTLSYHQIRTDQSGLILPWYSDNLGRSYDFILNLVWNFWKGMDNCPNGLKYYLQHRIWQEWDPPEGVGLGGDQLAMALSSWNLLYGYLGDQSVLTDMNYIANHYIDHGLSPSTHSWPNLPYPYNCDNPDSHQGVYDGDLIAGLGYTQPDKAGSLGIELVTLYKITANSKYLEAAVRIANTLANKTTNGNYENSPLPYRVRTSDGRVHDAYTSNWVGTLLLFEELAKLNQGNVAAYNSAQTKIINWLKTYPLINGRWGPFFEDIDGWSNTAINADTLAWYILENPDRWGSSWKADSRKILDEVLETFDNETFDNRDWRRYGVVPINEQTAYMTPGNSHTSRHGSVELIYCEKTGDCLKREGAIRQLNWATYMVAYQSEDPDGVNRYPQNDIWLTDGYGDYVRHYLRAMAVAPELAPDNQDHLLKTTSVIKEIDYAQGLISYQTFDHQAQEVLRITFSPEQVTAGGFSLPRLTNLAELENDQGYLFNAAGDASGVLRIRHDQSGNIVIRRSGVTPSPSPTPSRLLGDINLDGEVNTQDALVLFSLYRKQIWLDIYAPDPDRDGQVTLHDFGYIIRDWGS